MNSEKYKLRFTNSAIKQLRKMDSHQSMLVTRWLYQNIDDVLDPRKYGKALKGNMLGLWRYRVGNYRVIVEIEDTRLVVTAITIGHRKNVYG